jgi:hypothetical protein
MWDAFGPLGPQVPPALVQGWFLVSFCWLVATDEYTQHNRRTAAGCVPGEHCYTMLVFLNSRRWWPILHVVLNRHRFKFASSKWIKEEALFRDSPHDLQCTLTKTLNWLVR